MVLTRKKYEQRVAILDTIYTQGPISRVDISDITNITPATVTELSGQLMQEGIIQETGEEVDSTKAGRRKVLLDISSGYSYYLGIELSEAFTVLCVTDNLGNIMSKEVYYKDVDSEYDAEHIIEEVEEFLSTDKLRKISAIGIAIPGHFDEEEERIQSNRLFWREFNLSKIIHHFDIPVYVKNNVKCMALDQNIFERQNIDKFIFLHVKRGIFASIFYDYELYGEDNFTIGEIGHMVVNPNGEQCECGLQGCLQTVLSETWLIKKAKLLYGAGESMLNHIVSDPDNIDIHTILRAYHLGDQAIIKMIKKGLSYLAMVIQNTSMTTDAETIFIHGELFLDGEMQIHLRQLINQKVSLFDVVHPQTYKFVRYDVINGAKGGAALAITESLLKEDAYDYYLETIGDN